VLPLNIVKNTSTDPLYAEEPASTRKAWRNDVYEELNASGQYKVAERWLSCSDAFKTKISPQLGAKLPSSAEKAYVCSADHTHDTIIYSQSCDLRICPDCARMHSARLVARYLPKCEELLHSHHRNYMFRKIVFTTPFPLWRGSPFPLDGEWIRSRLLEGFDWVSKAMNEVMSEKCPDWKASQGYLASYEFGEEGKKLHFHVVHYGNYLDQGKLVTAWKKASGGEAFVVDVRTFVHKGKNLEESLKETLKYATKFYSKDKVTGQVEYIPAFLMPVLAQALEGTRRIRSAGVFYNLPEPKRDTHTCETCNSPMVAIPLDYFVIYCNTGLLPHEFYDGDAAGLHLKPADKSPPQSTASPPESPENRRIRQMEMDILKKVRWQRKDEF